MDRVQLLLLGLPLYLLCSDVVNLFTPPPRPPPPHRHHRNNHPDPRPYQPPVIQTPDISAPLNLQTRGVGYGTTVELNFCTSCSYRGNALTMKKMLETSFPGIDVVLSNYPPPLPKRILSKLVPVAQAGVFGIMMGGDQILPRLGYVQLPPWYLSLRANKFGTIASTWLFGNFAQNFLQSTGAFEVYCNGYMVYFILTLADSGFGLLSPNLLELEESSTVWIKGSQVDPHVFSKLKEQRFPSEIELRNLIQEHTNPRFVEEGKPWSD